MSQEIERIKEIIENDIKPMLAMHLGSLDFVSYEDGIVRVRMQGKCKGCPLSTLTLKGGIEYILKSKIPNISAVEAVE